MKTYITIITTDAYLKGVLALHQSLMMTKPKYGFVAIVTDQVSKESEKILEQNHIETKRIDYKVDMSESSIRKNEGFGFKYWNSTLSKIAIFGLTEYKKVVYLDADMIVLQNIDILFEKPHFSGVIAGALCPGCEDWKGINSGLMVVEPQKGLDVLIASFLPQVEKAREYYGDQDLLFAYFPNWWEESELQLDHKYNVFFGTTQHYINHHGYNINFNNPDEKTITVVHFVGSQKPWMMQVNELLEKVKGLEKAGQYSDAKILNNYVAILKGLN